MGTGLGIRDFIKVYREVQYSEQGSIRLTETEHNAYLNRLTLEVTHYDAYRSVNFKTAPDNTHWGYFTAFKGSSVCDSKAVKFAKQRVFECINQGIWNYHQNTESVVINSELQVAVANSIVSKVLDQAIPFPGFELIIKDVEAFEDNAGPLFKWLFEIQDENDGTEPPSNKRYTGFPVVSPFPDVFKFKSDIPLSFKFRLESWYLVNPAVYILSNPTDSEDATDDESEYPSPDPGNGSGEGANFPPSSAPAPGSDSRDYAPDDGQPGTGTWTFVVSFGDPGNNPFCNNVPAATLQLRGFPDEPPRKEFTGPQVPEGGRPGRFFTSVASVPFGGTCGLSEPGSATFIPDGPSN